MANIDEVIDLMVANGEPEEKIIEVINYYNSQLETKNVTPPADAPVEESDMASELEDGSSELQEEPVEETGRFVVQTGVSPNESGIMTPVTKSFKQKKRLIYIKVKTRVHLAMR